MNRFLAHCLLITSLSLTLSQTIYSAEWKSPDGMVSLSVPDPARFEFSPPTPDCLVIWEAKNESLTMFVVASPVPGNQTLIKAFVEFGFLDELKKTMKNVQLLSSTSERQGSFEALLMTAQADNEEGTHYVTQKLILVNSKVYNAVARSINKDTRNHPDVTAFVNSFKITEAGMKTPPPGQTAVVPNPVQADPDPALNISRLMGRIAAPLLLVALILYFVQGKKKPKATKKGSGPPPLPPRNQDDE